MGAYDATIDDDAPAVFCARTEAAHKEKRTNRGTYETARRETTQFILAAVEDTWVRELQDPETIYMEVAPEALLSQLQVGCTGRDAIDLLELHNEMQCYHLEAEAIPENINMLKDAQKQAGRAGRTIANKTLLLFSITKILTTELYLRTNDDWYDRTKEDKTWADW